MANVILGDGILLGITRIIHGMIPIGTGTILGIIVTIAGIMVVGMIPGTTTMAIMVGSVHIITVMLRIIMFLSVV
jgi:hypothetical protein